MAISFGTTDMKISLGDYDIGKISLGDVLLYTSGSIVTYHVDNDIVYVEEVDGGESCLTPQGFVPAKDGWEFMGWTEASDFSGSVLTEKLMDDAPITLYAVFRHPITLTYYNDSTSASTLTKDAYYNNGNISNPHFEIEQVEKSGWISYGWTTDTAADSAISYASDAGIQLDSDITLYGRYIQTVTVTYYNNSTTASSVKGTRHYNSSGNILNPSFTLTQAAKSGWTARGWATGTTGDAIIVLKNGGTFERGSNYTLYGMYQQTITVSYAGNGATSGSTAAQTGTRYYNSNGNVVNPKFTLSANGFAKTGYSFTKWALGSAGGTQYAAGASVTLSANTTFYALWTSNAFYWIKNGAVQSGYPSSYVQSYLNYSNAILNNVLVDFDLVGVQEGNTTFRGTTAVVNTKGNKYMEVKIGSSYCMDGRLDSFTIAGTNYASQMASSKTLTIDVGKYSTVSIYLDVTAWAWGNHASIQITSIRFYS